MKAVVWIRSIIIVFAIFAIGCTRPVNSNVSMSIAIPNLSSLKNQKAPTGTTTTCPQRIMINVSGPAITQPIQCQCQGGAIPCTTTGQGNATACIWQGNNNNGNCDTPPNTVSYGAVPNSSPLFVQILEIDTDQLSDMMFYYDGETPQAQGSALAVTLNPVQLGVTAGQGQIAGRYLDATDVTNGHGKTGMVGLFFTPPGAPSMLVDTEEIFGGWFDFFSPVGSATNPLQMSYVFEDGTTLFSAGADAADGVRLLNGTQSMLVQTPAYYSSNNNQANGGNVTIAGFFGAGYATASPAPVACYNPNTDETLANVDSLNAADDSTGQSLEWIGGGTADDPSDQVYVASGGSSNTGLGCPSTPPAVPTPTMLYFNETQIGQNGGGQNPQSVGFYGPFVAVPPLANGINFLTATTSSNPTGITLTWAYQQTALQGLSGADVFYTTTAPTNTNGNAPFQSQTGNGMNCAAIADPANPWGFQSVSGVTFPSTTSVTIATSETPSSPAFAAVVCPYRTTPAGVKSYFTTAAAYQNNNGGGGESAQIVVTSASGGSDNTIAANTCAEYTLSIEDMSGTPITLSSALDFSLSDSSSMMTFYAPVGGTCTCASSANSSVTVSPGDSTANFCILSGSTNGVVGNYDWLYVDQPQTAGSSGVYFTYQPQFEFSIGVTAGTQVSAGNPGFLNISSPPDRNNTQVVTGQCYLIYYTIEQTSEPVTPSTTANGDAVEFTPTSSAGGTFHQAPDCSDSAIVSPSTLTIPGGTHGIAVYYQPSTGSFPYNENLSATMPATSPSYSYISDSSLPTPASYDMPLAYIVGSAVPAGVSVNVNQDTALTYNGCYQVDVGFMNSFAPTGVNPAPINQNSLTTTYSVSVSDGGAGGSFYSSSQSCTGSGCCQGTASAGSSTISIGPTTNNQLYYLAPSSGSSVNFTASSGSLTSGTASLTLSGAP